MKKPFIIGSAALIVVTGVILFFINYGSTTFRQTSKIDPSSGDAFATNISGLTEAKPTEIVELKNGDTYNLTASIVKKNIDGQTLKMLAYNGSIPGPVIKVPQGAEITLNFTNNTDVETTIHSHGVRLENKFDGVPDVTQKAVSIGESFTYKVKFPDEGMYWYHPHIREDYAQELGLYGNYWVVPSNANYWSTVNREIPIFLDDILIENGKIVAFSKEAANHTLMGRFGNTILINGETNYALNAKQGEIIRLYFTNSANTRTFNISIPGAQMKLVGGDSGKYEKETFAESVILSPSERAIVEVLFSKSGTYLLTHKTPEKTYKLGSISVISEQIAESYEKSFSTMRTNSEIVGSITPFRVYFDNAIDKKLKLSLTMKPAEDTVSSGNNQHMMHGGSTMDDSMMRMEETQLIEWEDDMGMMNRASTIDTLEWKVIDEDTDSSNADIDWKFKVGDKVKIQIFNDPKSMHPMQHPIHLHGQRFLILNEDGKKNDNLVWKDTVLIPSGTTVELLVDMVNPGEWMVHCHIAEHLEAGMMFGFKVE